VTAAGDGGDRAREIENLRAVYQSLQRSGPQEATRPSRGRGVAAGAAGAGLLFVLGKAKVLGFLAGVLNLVPVPPLDGGRIAGAFTRTAWVVGYAVGVAALLVTGSPVLLLVLVVGLWTLVRRWRDPVPGGDALPRRQRALIALAYAALVVGLVATLSLGA